MIATATEIFPLVDATKQDCITDEQARFFLENGLLVIRNVLRGAELKAMQDETLPFVQRAMRERVNDPDYLYKKHELTGAEVPFRVEYVIDKTTAGKALLGHPFILRSVEKLQGRNFIPTWDSMVFKMEGAGASIPWHRDGGMDFYTREHFGTPIFNVDFYLDGADLTNCLWGLPGSNLWDEPTAQAKIAELNEGVDGLKGSWVKEVSPSTLQPVAPLTHYGAVPIPMNPGDVIFHNILVLHGSPPCQSKLRRVVYYEFRPAEIERSVGPHIPEYIPLKQKVLLACLRHRAETPYARGEKPFVYNPSEEFAPPPLGANEKLETYRYPHQQFWRKK
jgi:ectoine hydroxylase-related dioxygenase (phytanoyl-CoA dioxygenase family)